MTTADAVLVLRCQDEDYEAFDEIVARYKDGIYNYIWRMISNRDDVEDLTQEVFVRAFARIKTFRRDSNLRTWLYKIASNLCIDRYRRAGLEKKWTFSLERRQDDSAAETTELPDISFDPQLIYERTELQQEVHKAIGRLSAKLRATVLLYDMECMSYEEIADTLDCPIGTVKSRLFAARVQLREFLKPYVEDRRETIV